MTTLIIVGFVCCGLIGFVIGIIYQSDRGGYDDDIQ